MCAASSIATGSRTASSRRTSRCPTSSRPSMPATPGRHLALNGHMDVFPVDSTGWTVDPWGGELIDGKIYGRGACDMKCGTTTSLFTFLLPA